MEVYVFSLVLLLVLSATLPAEAQNWKEFKNKHIYLNMPENKCTNTIKERKINNGGACKTMNSFIVATDDQVKAVCGRAGHRVRGNLYESNLRFNVITCIKKELNPCSYDGRQNALYILIKCERGFPVHYEGQRSSSFP
ncbi:sialic acid-binding lectin-like [Clarias gariepinus]|uniref:sialic acid-binding lectin-like n=1 Tax=Clarias gariepinus TaxID=13013 RepID=UPI00234C80E7|nr:sialic acid-binding lectin-like [Clarias gariepinus]